MEDTMTKSKGHYETPIGSFDTWDEAAAACERCDFDPCECVRYVAPVDIYWIYEYGLSQKLSGPIRCF